MSKVYSFIDVAGKLDSISIISSEGEPVSVDFTYFDKEGIAWKVHTEGFRKKTGETREKEKE